ncbi:MAG: hypothetical protein A49_05970 [Methyloceanibacter sp.]|nr:MAG: hypothetical protein A49_05970 [Methyloceanibacter sp.]
MSEYGVQPTGFVRKPLTVILAEIEAAMITEFGPDVIQTPQSPFGQLNGTFADLVNELWERAEDLYQSYDPDQAEGTRLDTLGRIRLLPRGQADDAEFRGAITNAGRARIDLQDLSRAIAGLEGVTYSQVFTNEAGEVSPDLGGGTVAVAVIGGVDEEIATTMRRYIVPGVNTYGNYVVSSEIDGYCRSSYVIRPIPIPITLTLDVRASNDRFGCPPPSPTAIREALITDWYATRLNGLDVTSFTLRSLIESRFPNIELVSFVAERDAIEGSDNQPVAIGFIEIAELAEKDITVSVA